MNHVTRDTAICYAYQELSSSIQTMSVIFHKGHISRLSLCDLNQEIVLIPISEIVPQDKSIKAIYVFLILVINSEIF